MNQSPDTELIISLAREVVEQVAPEELILFPAISADYTRKPDHILKMQPEKDDFLSFDMGELGKVLVPFIIYITQQAVYQMSIGLTKKGVETLFQRVKKKMFNRSSSNKQDTKLASSQYTLDEIREQAVKTALAFKIPPTKAEQIGYALVGGLASKKVELEKKE